MKNSTGKTDGPARECLGRSRIWQFCKSQTENHPRRGEFRVCVLWRGTASEAGVVWLPQWVCAGTALSHHQASAVWDFYSLNLKGSSKAICCLYRKEWWERKKMHSREYLLHSRMALEKQAQRQHEAQRQSKAGGRGSASDMEPAHGAAPPREEFRF